MLEFHYAVQHQKDISQQIFEISPRAFEKWSFSDNLPDNFGSIKDNVSLFMAGCGIFCFVCGDFRIPPAQLGIITPGEKVIDGTEKLYKIQDIFHSS